MVQARRLAVEQATGATGRGSPRLVGPDRDGCSPSAAAGRDAATLGEPALAELFAAEALGAVGVRSGDAPPPLGRAQSTRAAPGVATAVLGRRHAFSALGRALREPFAEERRLAVGVARRHAAPPLGDALPELPAAIAGSAPVVAIRDTHTFPRSAEPETSAALVSATALVGGDATRHLGGDVGIAFAARLTRLGAVDGGACRRDERRRRDRRRRGRRLVPSAPAAGGRAEDDDRDDETDPRRHHIALQVPPEHRVNMPCMHAAPSPS